MAFKIIFISLGLLTVVKGQVATSHVVVSHPNGGEYSYGISHHPSGVTTGHSYPHGYGGFGLSTALQQGRIPGVQSGLGYHSPFSGASNLQYGGNGGYAAGISEIPLSGASHLVSGSIQVASDNNLQSNLPSYNTLVNSNQQTYDSVLGFGGQTYLSQLPNVNGRGGQQINTYPIGTLLHRAHANTDRQNGAQGYEQPNRAQGNQQLNGAQGQQPNEAYGYLQPNGAHGYLQPNGAQGYHRPNGAQGYQHQNILLQSGFQPSPYYGQPATSHINNLYSGQRALYNSNNIQRDEEYTFNRQQSMNDRRDKTPTSYINSNLHSITHPSKQVSW